MNVLHRFKEVWCGDFEFHAPPGERPEPICMVAQECFTNRTIRLGADKLAALPGSQFPMGGDALFVAYYASAELGCFRALGWPPPAQVLDLFTEFRCLTNGLATMGGNGLIGALSHHGIACIDAAEKDAMRGIAIRGGPFTPDERRVLLAYCESDVRSLGQLLRAMLPKIDLPRALLRGRYMQAAAVIESTGTPIDTDTLARLRSNWKPIQANLIRAC